jgi:hypothetical protein
VERAQAEGHSEGLAEGQRSAERDLRPHTEQEVCNELIARIDEAGTPGEQQGDQVLLSARFAAQGTTQLGATDAARLSLGARPGLGQTPGHWGRHT